MKSFDELTCLFRSPQFPVIIEIEGVLVAAKSLRPLYERLSRLDIVERKAYISIDRTGEAWTFILMDGMGVLTPITFRKQPTKLELIRWFNNRKNKPANEVEYSEKSLSSKRLDFIVGEIADRLLNAEKRNARRRD